MSAAETKHTPGPWKFSFESIDPDWAIVTNEQGAIVANVNSETGPDAASAPATRKMPMRANARLIAAAPDLLAAAKEALDQAEGCWREHYGEDPEAMECPTPHHIALLRDAIAKATT